MTENESVMDPIALRDDERQRSEVWTRVRGYHRPLASFNDAALLAQLRIHVPGVEVRE